MKQRDIWNTVQYDVNSREYQDRIVSMDKEREAESSGYHESNLPINLPQAFRDLKFAKRMAIDIGE